MKIRMLRKMVVVPPDPFRGMGAQRNSAVNQQSSHASRSGPENSGAALRGDWGRTVSPLLTKVIFVNRLKPMRKYLRY